MAEDGVRGIVAFHRDCSVYAGAATLPAKYDRIRDAFRTLITPC